VSTALVDRYVRFAQSYVQLTQALQRQGVPESTAREEARWAATSMLISETPDGTYDPAKGQCPTCGRG
jgi:hypothetical protein